MNVQFPDKHQLVESYLTSFERTDLFFIVQLSKMRFVRAGDGCDYFERERARTFMSCSVTENYALYKVEDDGSIDYSSPIVWGPDIIAELNELEQIKAEMEVDDYFVD